MIPVEPNIYLFSNWVGSGEEGRVRKIRGDKDSISSCR